MTSPHSFHIPVMGIGFTIDTPLKVAQYGIDSVVSLGDDILLEKLRKKFCDLYQQTYLPISDEIIDHRAKRITAYLDLLHDLCNKKFEALCGSGFQPGSELTKYLKMLPNDSVLPTKVNHWLTEGVKPSALVDLLKTHLYQGRIDVNIMTKVDKVNYRGKEQLSQEYNDAHAALRGFAQSKLQAALVLSAGLNPRLYAYMENFDDFFPNQFGQFKKQIILKVSDFRSAQIQGRFLAKKGLWVSEYRIESGLNCGGHAFATDGLLLGPILEEFKQHRHVLAEENWQLCLKAWEVKSRLVPHVFPRLRITAQGGVGTADEHQFLLEEYQLDSVGWGSPFLLVPEAVNVDHATLQKLKAAKEADLYRSDISPLGIPFNNLRNNTKDLEKMARIVKGKPGSPCPKRFLALNNEFEGKRLCTASRKYQFLKLKELDSQEISQKAYEKAYKKILEKACICVGLGTPALLKNDIATKLEGPGVAVCPGPNMAYYDQEVSLVQMIDHIYGKGISLEKKDRPNLFVKELSLYLEYLNESLEEFKENATAKQEKNLKGFIENLNIGLDYYQSLFGKWKTAAPNLQAIFVELCRQKSVVLSLNAHLSTAE